MVLPTQFFRFFRKAFNEHEWRYSPESLILPCSKNALCFTTVY